MSIDLSAAAEFAAAVGAGGLFMGLIDRWRYRGRPRLDVADLAQRVAAETLTHARAEIDRAWQIVERYEAEVDTLRAEVRDLRKRVDQSGSERDALARQLAEREAALTDARAQLSARTAEAAALRDEVGRLTGLTQHAQAAGRAPITGG
ncbi:hypothetical protein AB0I55_29150 [Actinocatenispora sera]|uniref:hypothetical protein n=1 Tax=Actinocatenispora sera TaxID=390989 RepID=UPI0033E86811